MCPVPTPLPDTTSILLELEPETHLRLRLAADLEGKTVNYYLLELIEREVYEKHDFTTAQIEEARMHVKGQRTPGAIPWSRGLSRAYRTPR